MSGREHELRAAVARRDFQAVADWMPYVRHLGIRVAADEQGAPRFTLPFREELIGNRFLPAIHGGVIGGLLETAALVHVLVLEGEPRLPKLIDCAVDYLRSAGPQDCHAACELLRQGRRVAAVSVRCWQADPARPIASARAHFLLTDPDR
jgi:uncharacterized protein (TIGR00369 family)